MAFYFYLSTKIIMVFITKSYQDLFGVRSYINALMNVTYIGCHPCTNTCSLKIKMEDILTVWLPATGHDDMKVIE